MLDVVEHACNPSYTRGIGQKIVVQGKPWEKNETLPEIPKTKKGGGSVAQVVKVLSSKREALSSNPIPSKNK
jgi:hypothetical protein